MDSAPNQYIPPIALLAKMGFTYIRSAEGLMPGEKYDSFRNGPESAATQWVCLWNDGTVQIMKRQPGWQFFNSTLGPFADEAHFLHALNK